MNHREHNPARQAATVFMLLLFILGYCVANNLAKASMDEAGFIAAIRADGMAGADHDLIANGRWVCDQFLDSDWNYDQLAAKFRETNQVDVPQSLRFVADSVKFLCPQYAPREHAPAGGEMHPGSVV
ncbi:MULTISPECIES: DUF732 domain-containing protein [Mycobacterium]|uniref:DUF732 domain-containing protein n=1 Tax=Mycobacterium colombiense TaxID=339268 RepID=A0A329M2T6_9MYCO|nr:MULTISPECIES: DUF732 domain-containing protein [Mycobacterium]MDM4138790.1 DUF732 domain-containing protein [Mycobacterium sp. FLAC0960]RAV14078.1 hypothetical protein DQP57_06845 [Mycobacterium colombiense]